MPSHYGKMGMKKKMPAKKKTVKKMVKKKK